MNPIDIFYLILGLVILTYGAELLISNASRLAGTLGVSSLVIGLTVVAFGTSAPELAVSLGAALKGSADIAVGNVIGSNICNTWLILGVCAVVMPLVLGSQIIKLEVPIMIAASFAFYLMSLDNQISRLEGSILFACLLAYTYFTISRSRREVSNSAKEDDSNTSSKISTKELTFTLVKCVIGLAFLVYGADLFVSAASDMARAFGVSELVIGLTIVAIGTSLPELMTSLVATYKGERDIAIGNVVGSNIFNILTVIGISSMVKPIGVSPAAVSFDLPIMLLAVFMCFPFFLGLVLNRWRGAIFLFCFILYTTYIVLNTRMASIGLQIERFAIFIFLPLLVATMIAMIIGSIYKRNKGAVS